MVVRITCFALALVVVSSTTAARAEQSDSRPKPPNSPLPTQPRLVIRSEELFPISRPARIGVFTLAPPETNGEVIRLSVPVGEFVMKSVRAIADARRRAEERKVEQRIAKELRELHQD